MFHADAVYLCSQHNLACKTVNCPDYTEFTSISGSKKRGSIFASLPVGTQVNFLGRPIKKASFPDIEFKFQATLVWPQLSKKPSSVTKPQDSVLDEQLRKFVLLEQRFIEDSDSNMYISKYILHSILSVMLYIPKLPWFTDLLITQYTLFQIKNYRLRIL